MDINSLIANYLKNTSNNEVSASQIKDTFYSLANEDLQNYDSIFVYGEDATKDELIEYMSRACGKDDAQFKEDVGLLFDVLNSNSDDDVLTDEELEEFTRERGENKGKIDGFGIWNELLNTDVSQIESNMAEIDTTSVSQNIIQGYLRQDLGYKGLVISDDMVMGGIKRFSSSEACIRAINAGVNMFIFRNSDLKTLNLINDLEKAVADKKISMDNIDKSIEIIQKVKCC